MIVIPDEPNPVKEVYAASFHRACATGFSPHDFRCLGKVRVGAGTCARSIHAKGQRDGNE